MRFFVKDENDGVPSAPTGFESLAAFTLKRVQDGEKQETQNVLTRSASIRTSELQLVKMEMDTDTCADTNITRSLRHRAWINYGQLDTNSSEDESGSAKLNQVNIPYYCIISIIIIIFE